jgi:hypothetical protein
MINRPVRDQLKASLLSLVSGEMTNDAFDDRYHGGWKQSEDAAIAEIARFGWTLYSDTHPYKLKGWYAVPDDVRLTSDRAMLFLGTDLEYEWPENVNGVTPFFVLWGPGCYLVIGMILLFVAAFTPGMTIFLGLFGILALVPTIHWFLTHSERAEELKRFQQSGDLDFWPFLRKSDYETAKRDEAAPTPAPAPPFLST